MNTKIEISNNDDLIDSRDIIKRIEYLEQLKEDWQEDWQEDSWQDDWQEGGTALSKWNGTDEGQELVILLDLQSQCVGSPEWEDGMTLVRDSSFKEFAQQEAEDLGLIKEWDKWPSYCIDWDWAADELKNDYSRVNFDGVTYWIK